MTEVLLALALLLLCIAAWLQAGPVRMAALRRRIGAVFQPRVAAPQSSGSSSGSLNQHQNIGPAGGLKAAKPMHIGTHPGHLRVLNHLELLQLTGADRLLEHLARNSKLAKVVFERDFLPAVQAYAEFVQLMPASESHHHANVGGLLTHTLETVAHAMVLRAGYLLPRNGTAEIIDAQRDYWTYAIFMGALLHDVGKPMADLRIEMLQRGGNDAMRWMPMAGSLVKARAEEYQVKFTPKGERDYTAHGKLGVVLLQQLAPDTALSFLGRCPDVMHELTQYLGGDARQGVIAEIVSRADQQSTKSNLADGSRARFATARSVPLVEQLMNALQDMLRQGGLLPLNRSGAVGWIYDGSCWFVAKRLADSVREHILARAGEDAGIPGENKNDRLFDCWQEYGQLQLNPTTHQAIWHVVVHGTDGPGYEHSLTMLRFPLDKLWSDLSQAPQPMAGHIEVLTKRKAGDAAPGATAPALAQQGTAPTASDGKDAPPPQRPNAGAETGSEAVRRLAGAAVPTPQFETQGSKTKRAAAGRKSTPSDGAAPAADEFLPDDESALAAARAAKRAAAAAKVLAPPADVVIARRGAPDPAPQALVHPAAPTESPRTPAPSSAATDAPDDDGDEAPPWEIPATAPAAPTIGRVALHSDAAPPSERAGKGGREPSETAINFMRWVQTGLGDGSIKYNEAGATVHFVDAGLMLVSPAIFRAYAEIHGEPTTANLSPKKPQHQRVGMAVQREVLKSGWHLPSPADGTNIWTFQVARRGGTKVSALSGVVLADARRWVLEPPPPNPTLQLPSAAESAEPGATT